MSIQGLVNELQGIRNELKSLRQRGIVLRKNAAEIEGQITKYLDMKEQPGLKYKGVAIVKETRTINRIKKKDEHKAELLKLADDYGLKDYEKERFIEDIKKSKRGSPKEQVKLRFKTVRKKKDDI